MLNENIVIEMASNSFSESKTNFGRLIKRETFEKKEIWLVNIFTRYFL